MGPTVLDAGPARTGFHLYAQCLRDHSGGMAILAINTSQTRTQPVDLSIPADRYTLTARKLMDTRIELNGHQLKLERDNEVPNLQGTRVQAGPLELAPTRITFLAIEGAGNQSCR
jgi:hypothetical protein